MVELSALNTEILPHRGLDARLHPGMGDTGIWYIQAVHTYTLIL